MECRFQTHSDGFIRSILDFPYFEFALILALLVATFILPSMVLIVAEVVLPTTLQ